MDTLLHPGALPLRRIFLILAPSGFHNGWTGQTMRRSFHVLAARGWLGWGGRDAD